MRRIAWISILALAGCGDGPSHKAFGGPARDILKGATIVEAYRVQTPAQGEKPTEFDWWKWPMKSGPVPVDARLSAALVEFFLEDRSYWTGAPKPCIPTPGVKFRFARGAEEVAVLVCFECQQLMVKSTGGVGGSGDLNPVVPILEEIAKQIFPKDPEIQALTGRRWNGLVGLQEATSVEAWRISGGGIPVAPRPGSPPEKPPATYFDYKEDAGPLQLSDGQARSLIAVLSGPDLKEGARPCMPSPGVKLRFNRPIFAPVWVFLCFECNELSVYEGWTSRESRTFDAARSKLLAAVKPLFPKDDAIQGLK